MGDCTQFNIVLSFEFDCQQNNTRIIGCVKRAVLACCSQHAGMFVRCVFGLMRARARVRVRVRARSRVRVRAFASIQSSSR